MKFTEGYTVKYKNGICTITLEFEEIVPDIKGSYKTTREAVFNLQEWEALGNTIKAVNNYLND